MIYSILLFKENSGTANGFQASLALCMFQLCDLRKVAQLIQLSVSFSVKLYIRELRKFRERKRD